MVPNLKEESGKAAISENFDGLTAGHKPIISDDVGFLDENLPSGKRMGKRKEHVEVV